MKRLKGFTLAEVLITLAIIGVVAALTIPSVISNSQQQEFKTGLRKAVSVLNSAITMNMAIDGESPYDNANLFGYLMKHMSILKTTSAMELSYTVISSGNRHNVAFYTTDGMRFEFAKGHSNGAGQKLVLYESGVQTCARGVAGNINMHPNGFGEGESWEPGTCGGCGSYGLNSNPDGTTKPPCLITVDVNGDRKPNPDNVNCKDTSCAKRYKYSDPLGLKLTDMFTIMITDKQAIPYGVAAQRAMYQAQSKK